MKLAFAVMCTLFASYSICSAKPASLISTTKLENAVKIANRDAVGPGYCGRGVWTVLNGIGYGNGLESANGHDWEANLRRAGWGSVSCDVPARAPVGSVLVYNSDKRKYGRNKTGTKGGYFGHVELVALRAGKRVYVSDAPRDSPGGTVLKNFTGRAWVPPKKSSPLPNNQPIPFRATADAVGVVTSVSTMTAKPPMPSRVTMRVKGLDTTALPEKRLNMPASQGYNFYLGKQDLHPQSYLVDRRPKVEPSKLLGAAGLDFSREKY